MDNKIDQILQQSPHQVLLAIRNEKLSFFKGLANLPDGQARLIYEGFVHNWDKIESRLDETMDELEALLRTQQRCPESYDRISALLNKAEVGFEIKKDHEDKRIPFGQRLAIEATLVEAMDRVVDMVVKYIDHIKSNSELTKSHESDLQIASAHLSDVFFDTHERYLKSYLGIPW